MVWPSRLAKTLCIQTGRKLADQARDDVVKAVRDQFNSLKVVAIQMGYEVIRVTFSSEDDYRHAMERPGLHLFGIFCRILGGGPPITMVHVFDFPFEEDDSSLKTVFADFGDVKGVKKQTYLFDKNISTGTRLVSLVLKGSLPRSLTINGYLCRVWYKGQPLVCNLCGIQGHKSDYENAYASGQNASHSDWPQIERQVQGGRCQSGRLNFQAFSCCGCADRV